MIRSWVCSTRSTISENFDLTWASGNVSDMTSILVIATLSSPVNAKTSTLAPCAQTPVTSGLPGSVVHSCSDAMYTAMSVWPNRAKVNAVDDAAMPPPQ